MRLSIAMATWNGARYLREQLDSFRGQTRLPDEVVVCDDHSTDGTATILEEFRRTAPFPVNVSINPKQVGYVGNFEQAVRLCDGDLIFLSDQDDVWLPEKLAEHEAVYRSRPEVGMVFSDATIVDSDLVPLSLSVYEYAGVTPKRLGRFAAGRGLDLFIRKPIAYGCAVSIRSDLRPLILPIPPHWVHDALVPDGRLRPGGNPLNLEALDPVPPAQCTVRRRLDQGEAAFRGASDQRSI